MQKKSELKKSCSRCNAKAGKKCRNTKTGEIRNAVHPERLGVKKTTSKKVATLKTKSAMGQTKIPANQMTDEQKAIGKMIEEKAQEILGEQFPLKFVGPVTQGPVITTYRFQLMKRTKVQQMEGLAKDFALLLGAESVWVRRIPGETVVGVYVPNKHRVIINFRDTISPLVAWQKQPTDDGHKRIPLNLGQDSDGMPFADDLTAQPHLLIAGTTGGGKSTLMHAIVAGFGYAMNPAELKLLISDTKGVEFPHFKDLPHLRAPIMTTVFQTLQEMDSLTKETQLRMNQFATTGARNIHDYNKKAGGSKMPYIVLIIDELADLMGKHVDKDIATAASNYLQDIVGRSRASGIYVIAGTQRPDVKTVAGAIKANFPSRLSFRLPSQQDSRTVLNVKGAESLMSRGDMLYSSSTSPELKRLHAPFTSIEDVRMAVQLIANQYQGSAASGTGTPAKTPAGNPGFGSTNSVQ